MVNLQGSLVRKWKIIKGWGIQPSKCNGATGSFHWWWLKQGWTWKLLGTRNWNSNDTPKYVILEGEKKEAPKKCDGINALCNRNQSKQKHGAERPTRIVFARQQFQASGLSIKLRICTGLNKNWMIWVHPCSQGSSEHPKPQLLELKKKPIPQWPVQQPHGPSNSLIEPEERTGTAASGNSWDSSRIIIFRHNYPVIETSRRHPCPKYIWCDTEFQTLDSPCLKKTNTAKLSRVAVRDMQFGAPDEMWPGN